MNEQKIVILDITDCKSLGELHQRIKKAFDFPDFYGENWSAFWDMLWSECDADRVEIIGEYTLPKEFEPHISILHEILKRNRAEQLKFQHDFRFEIIN